MRRPTHSLFRDTRGAAYAETLLMMPVFLSLFAGVGFFHHYYTERLDAGRLARRCGWAFANGGCEDIPAECQGVVGQGSNAPSGPLSDPESQRDAEEVEDELGTLEDRIPVPGARGVVEAILGTTTTARDERDVALPGWVGGGTRQTSGQYALLCNEKEKTMGDIVRDAFCAAVDRFGAGILCGD